MPTNKKTFVILVAVVLVIVLGLIWFFGRHPQAYPSPTTSQAPGQTYTNAKGEKWGPLPQGAQSYSITSADDVFPKFVSATIDPLDVQIGQVQKMTVVVNDTATIQSVVAQIETDTGVENVPLRQAGVQAVTKEDFLNRDYFVRDGVLNILDNSNRQYAIPDDIKPLLAENIPASFIKTAMAQGTVLQKYTYEGEWTAHDTHVKTYHTTFVVKDVADRTNQIVMAWSDSSCGLPNYGTGDKSISSNCYPPVGTTGWDGGNITVSANVILSNNVRFAWAPGKQIIINSLPPGSFTISSGGQLIKKYLFYTDQDGDGFSPSASLIPSSQANNAGAIRMSIINNDPLSHIDCDDNPADAGVSVWPGNPTFYPSARPDGSWDYNCDGSGNITGYPGGGVCDTNSGLMCDAIKPNGATGYTVPVSCGAQGTYVSDPGTSCGGGGCVQQLQTASCVAPAYQYPSLGQIDNNSGRECDPLYPNGVVGWEGSVPGCGQSGTFIVDPGQACGGPTATTETRIQGCR